MRSRDSSALVLLAVLASVLIPLSCRSGAAPAPTPAVSSAAPPKPSAGRAEAEDPSAEGSLQKVLDLEGLPADLWHLQSGEILLGSHRDFFALIQGDTVQKLPQMGRGLPPEDGTDDRGTVQWIQGRWPDGLWLVWRDYDTWSTEMNMWYHRLFRYRNDRWVRVHESHHEEGANDLYRGLWEQPEGCLVGLTSDDSDDDNAWLSKVEDLDCPGKQTTTFPFKATKQYEYGVVAVLGFASGHVLVLEQVIMKEDGAPIPPRLALSRPGPPNRTEIELPLPPEITRDRKSFKLDCKMLGTSPTDVYLVGSYDVPGGWIPLALRFDGTSFTPLPPPPMDYISSADLAEDGSLVIKGSSPNDRPDAMSVWVLPRGGSAWIEKPMPIEPKVGKAYRPRSVAARSVNDIWVVGYHETKEGKDSRFALYHSRGSAPSPTPAAGGAMSR